MLTRLAFLFGKLFRTEIPTRQLSRRATPATPAMVEFLDARTMLSGSSVCASGTVTDSLPVPGSGAAEVATFSPMPTQTNFASSSIVNSSVRAGLTIVPTFDASITRDPNAATIEATINSVIATYEAAIATPITVNITFSESSNGLGLSTYSMGIVPYSQFLSALTNTQSSQTDATALAHLPKNATTDPVLGKSNIAIHNANLKALGLPASTASDGTVAVNMALCNLTRSATNPNKADLFAVEAHEIDEVLGLGSALGTSNQSIVQAQDLFRYDQSGHRSFTTSASAKAFFSLDGTTDLIPFNQNPAGDYGDWVTGATPHVQDAFITAGVILNPDIEFVALDAQGYRLANAISPTIQAPLTTSVNQNGQFAFTGSNAISVTDNSGTTEQFSLTVQHGSLNLTTTTGLTVTGNGTGTVTLTGTLASLNTALATLHYSPSSGFHGSDTLSLSDKDTTDNLTGTKTVAITVHALPPTIMAPISVNLNQNSQLSFTASNAISIVDLSGTTEQLILTVHNGNLNFSEKAGLTVTGNGTSSVTLGGPFVSLNTALASLHYVPFSGYHGPDTLSLSDKDTTDSLTGLKSITITVHPLPPTIAAPTSISVNQDGQFAFTTINVTDLSGTTEQMTLSSLHGNLSFVTNVGLTVTGNGTGTVTLSGSLASLNTALATLHYSPKSGYHGPDTLSLTDKDTTDNLTGTKSVTVTVNALPPTIKAPASISVSHNSSVLIKTNNEISVTDPSGTNEQFTMTVHDGTLYLSTTTGLTITGNGTASITVSGPLTLLNAALATLKYNPKSGYIGTDSLSLTDKDPTDKLSTTASVAITDH